MPQLAPGPRAAVSLAPRPCALVSQTASRTASQTAAAATPCATPRPAPCAAPGAGSSVLLAAALALGVGLGSPARADLVIEGRAAQALHCATMLYMVSELLHDNGLLGAGDLDTAQTAAVRMLNYVPGTDDQKAQAMAQRYQRIAGSRSVGGLMDEFNETSPWCQQTFLR